VDGNIAGNVDMFLLNSALAAILKFLKTWTLSRRWRCYCSM